jgi:hypothetical protein
MSSIYDMSIKSQFVTVFSIFGCSFCLHLFIYFAVTVVAE